MDLFAGAGFAGATGESRWLPAVIFCSAAAAAEDLFELLASGCVLLAKSNSRFLAAKAVRNDNLKLSSFEPGNRDSAMPSSGIQIGRVEKLVLPSQ